MLTAALLFTAAAAISLNTETTQAATTNVTDGGDGAILQQAIYDASPGDTLVIVSPAVITLTDALYVDKEITISSGMSGNVTLLLSDTTYCRHIEVSDGTLTLNKITLTGHGSNGDGNGGIDSPGAVILNNCTISDCYCQGGYYDYSGGALYAEGGATLTGCAFENNVADGSGGGVEGYESDINATDCTFTDNSAANGGGIHTDGSVSLVSCTFSGNIGSYEDYGSTEGQGGAVYAYGNLSIIGSCSFNDNSAGWGGGAVYVGENLSITGNSISNIAFSNNSAGASGGAISAGNAVITFSSFTGNTAGNLGGAVYCYGYTTLTNCTLSGNSATAGNGGAVFMDNGGSMTSILTNCSFTDNTAYTDYIYETGEGGAVYAYGNFVLTGCNFFDNYADSDGGAVYSEAVTVVNCTLTGNTASSNDGGGIYAKNGDVVIIGCVMSENNAGNGGGGLCISNCTNVSISDSTMSGNASSEGGGISIFEPDFLSNCTLTNCTLSGNDSLYGGGIFTEGISLSLTLINCTLSGNTVSETGGGLYAGSVMLLGTVISGNYDSSGYENDVNVAGNDQPSVKIEVATGSGDLPDSEYSVIGIPTGFTALSDLMATVPSTSIPGSPEVGALGDNGTITPMSGLQFVPAIKYSDWGVYDDQLGRFRPATDYGTVGSVELNFTTPTASDLVVKNTSASGPGSLAWAVIAANNLAKTGTTVPGITFNSGVTGSINLASQIDITAPLSITGPGMNNLTIFSSSESRHFWVLGNFNITITNMTLSGNATSTEGNGGIASEGLVTLVNCEIDGCKNTGGDNGGCGAALYAAGGASLTDSTFNNNVAQSNGGGVEGNGSMIIASGCSFTGNIGTNGGAIDTDGAVSLTNNCVFANNKAYDDTGYEIAGNAGAVYMGGGVITDCTFTGNTSGGDAGAVFSNGNIVITSTGTGRCSFSDNSTDSSGYGSGGAVYSYGSAVIIGITFKDNSAASDGGAVELSGGEVGNNSSSISDCIFDGNSAMDGGGMAIEGDAKISGCTFTGNSANGVDDGSGSIQGGSGGGVSINYYDDPALTDCVFSGNSAFVGGGVYAAGGLDTVLILTNCTIDNNTAETGGGVYGTQYTYLFHVTVTNNVGCGVYSDAQSDGMDPYFAYLFNCIVAGNTSADDGSLLQYSGNGFVDFTTGLNLIEGEYIPGTDVVVTYPDIFGTNTFNPVSGVLLVTQDGIAAGTADPITSDFIASATDLDPVQQSEVLSALAKDQLGNTRPSDAVTYGAVEAGNPTITLSVSFVNGTQTNTVSVQYGDTVAKPADPVQDGYTFAGWFTAPDGGVQWDFSTPIVEETVLYAQWTPAQTFIVTFDPRNGEDTFTVNVDGGKTVAAPQAPTLADNIFQGWFTAPEGGSQWNFSTPVNASMTLYAQWRLAQTFTVTFDPRNGDDTSSAEVMEGKTVSAPSAPSWDGYTFKGWFTAPDGGTQWNFSSPVTGDMTLYAHWDTSSGGVGGVNDPGISLPAVIIAGFVASLGVLPLALGGMGLIAPQGTLANLLQGGTKQAMILDTTGEDNSVTFDPRNGRSTWATTVSMGNLLGIPGDPGAPKGKKFLYWSASPDGLPFNFMTPIRSSMILFAVYEDEKTGKSHLRRD